MMLKKLSLNCSVDKIYMANNQATIWLKAKAVVLQMRSFFHKRDATVKIKSTWPTTR
jgi:hypothetical protein